MCGNCRHLGSLSDSSAASPPPPHPPRPARRPTPKSLDLVDAPAAAVRERSRKRSSTLSNENINIELEADKKAQNLTFRSKNTGHEFDSKYRHFHRDFDTAVRKDYSRSRIVENQPAQVTYSLQESILLTAWAITYQSCKVSADKFQATYDKPAPDFKTIYAWRERLQSTGCLVDAHLNTETSSREASEGRIRRKRKRRYFRSISTNYNSSDDDPDRGRGDRSFRLRRFNPNEFISFNSERKNCDIRIESRKKPEINISEKVLVISDNEEHSRNKKCNNKSEDDSNSENKMYNEGNYTNGSVGRSSTSAKHSMADESKRSEGYLTENARSETPEITIVRSELAQMKSPAPVMSLGTQFQEDNYFDESISKKTNIESFLVPDIPKQSKQSKSAQPPYHDTSKEMFEDIVSESERYSSDGGFNTDVDINYSRVNSNKIVMKESDNCEQVSFTHFKKLNENNVRRLETLPRSEETHAVDSPIPKFNETKKLTKATVNSDSTNIEQLPEKNFSSAMKRIIRSMSNHSEDRSSENLEYVPTKIDPAMAKRNHILFKSTSLSEAITDTWTQSSNGSANTSLNKNAEPQNTNKSIIEDYLTDEDALYKDNKESDNQSDDGLKTPPSAPDIGSIRQKSDSPNIINNTDNFSTLLNFNFNNINTEDLALALKNIQNMSLNKSNTKINGVVNNKSPNKCVDEIVSPKKDNIPFLEDMFCPGSPSADNGGTKVNGKSDCLDLTDDLDIDQPKKVSSSISRFKSFAIPKPIMLNRLRGMLQTKETKSDSLNDLHNEKNVTRRRKKVGYN